MLKRLLGKLSALIPRFRPLRDKTERVLISVEQLGVMVVDKAALQEFSLGRKLAVRILCHLLLKERIHMLTDSRGRLIAMSNPEYERSVRRRADGSHETEVRFLKATKTMLVDPADVPPEPAPAAAGPDREGEDVRADSETATFSLPVPTQAAVDYEWFDFEAATGDPGAAKLPAERQTLPARRREPWPHGDGGVRENK